MVSTDVIFCEKISETGELDKEANSNTSLLIQWDTDNQKGVFLFHYPAEMNCINFLNEFMFGCTFTVIFCG